ncbi:DUF5703 domain-containing protein [Mucilaginibacter pedocola]|uniref:DUF5703 domain-containing protein n=1 Tax=Mucilaginibacter pedocola TaxID=1792845 RepID=A0A1S9PHS6_9SPHI|nr:DUF5703 domain-containing protein [Mucilaginibacter pedocola]OOQ60500.1 hypothetical protein BC343_24720 [Mucilaginibacter pedocola]
MNKKLLLLSCIFVLGLSHAFAQSNQLTQNNIVWHSPSTNSGESMPVGGGDIGLNVWVEKGDLLFYIARSGNYDENNALLKLGRVRIKLSSNPFEGGSFKQTLNLYDGCIDIETKKAGITTTIKVWVDVFSPNIHVKVLSGVPVSAAIAYENWQYLDTQKSGLENNENGFKFGATKPIKGYRDSVRFDNNGILFYHQNKGDENIFDLTVKQQGLEAEKAQLFNPLKNLIFGGMLKGNDMCAAGTYSGKYLNTIYKGWKISSTGKHTTYNFDITLHTRQQPTVAAWLKGLNQAGQTIAQATKARQATLNWWHRFWDRSFVHINTAKADTADVAWQSGRNYQLFRYMLACNAFGSYPTKFNGGLFTYDPALVNTTMPYTPDFRNWGGSIFTAQNQRLVYFPMLKNGDGDLLQPEFDFYLRILKTAEIATRKYWGHGGARFPEQIENFGLSDLAEYGINHPATLDPGVDDNRWLEYHWETVLEFCYMMLQTESYAGKDVSKYVPFIESCVDFFDQHYQYLAQRATGKPLDGEGHLILFPGSAGETFKMANNSTPTVAGLRTVVAMLMNAKTAGLSAKQREKFSGILKRIPPISYQTIAGHTTIAPAKSWERVNNEESPQLYPIYPYGIFGIDRPGLDTALNTWKYDTTVVKFRSHIGWKQDNIIAARLGLTDEASRVTFLKLKNSGRRFPAFWGPGFDWTPDHNWGGSGMIGLQEMLLQSNGDKIYLLPAWPKNLDVHFKLHTDKQTTVECTFTNGKVTQLLVLPASRRKDVVMPGY